jgi:tetratricopeptide (TPR) repeat protein
VDAYSGGFLALHRQYQQAEPLLKEAAQLDPKLALARRNLGFLHYFRQERAEALASFSAAIALDSQGITTRFLRAQLTFDDVSHSDAQIEEDLRQVLKVKPDFADANGLLAIYLANNNEKLPEALSFGQKAVSLEPGNPYFQLAFVDVLVRVRRYGDAEAVARRVRASATDDNIRGWADQLLTYIGQARDYEARTQQRQQEAAARANASALAARPEQAVARSDESTGDKVSEKVSQPDAPAPDPDAPVLKRRATPTDVIGVVIQVRCKAMKWK